MDKKHWAAILLTRCKLLLGWLSNLLVKLSIVTMLHALALSSSKESNSRQAAQTLTQERYCRPFEDFKLRRVCTEELFAEDVYLGLVCIFELLDPRRSPRWTRRSFGFGTWEAVPTRVLPTGLLVGDLIGKTACLKPFGSCTLGEFDRLQFARERL